MPVLLLVLVLLLIGHLAILTASQLRNFGLIGALQICSRTFDLCDDPLWVACVAAVLLAGIVWVNYSSSIANTRSSNSVPTQPRKQTATPTKQEHQQQVYLRPRPDQDPQASWDEDDFDVIEGDRVVGRIYRLTAGGDWLWGIVPEEMSPGRRARGREVSCEGAKAAFLEAWQSRGR